MSARTQRKGVKVRCGFPFIHTGVLSARNRSVTLHPFNGRHRKARVLAFQALQRGKALSCKSRRKMRKASQRRNRA